MMTDDIARIQSIIAFTAEKLAATRIDPKESAEITKKLELGALQALCKAANAEAKTLIESTTEQIAERYGITHRGARWKRQAACDLVAEVKAIV